jgi:phosphoribosylaminoimidazolecarboxamide formyltransferase/IMP cyclohydrolase
MARIKEIGFLQRFVTKARTALANRSLCWVGSLSGDLVGLDSAVIGMILTRCRGLRYGENPGQRAALYTRFGSNPSWRQLGGKDLSYNNILDFSAALRIVRSLQSERPVAVIVKHLNPCGSARADTLVEAIRNAKRGDPRSRFGGVFAVSTQMSAEAAREIVKEFCEIVVAPSYSVEALSVLGTRPHVRVIQAPLETPPSGLDIRVVEGGILLQETGADPSPVRNTKQVSKRGATVTEMRDLEFAWTVCSHVRSNAVVLVRGEMIIGVGAGQMSRVDAVEIAISKARKHGHELNGAVAASDAFFPFPDSILQLSDAGITAVVAEGGSKRDEEAILAADSQSMSFYMSPERHFRI